MFYSRREVAPICDLWHDGILCAFEFVCISSGTSSEIHSPRKKVQCKSQQVAGSKWVPIGWERITELVQFVQSDVNWSTQKIDMMKNEDKSCPQRHIWWCLFCAGHSSVDACLSHAHWLHPVIKTALSDKSCIISEQKKYLPYEIPVSVEGGLLFELLGHSNSNFLCIEDAIPIVLRSWQTHNFLVTVMHVKGSASNINVQGISEVQELLLSGGSAAPKSVHDVIAHLTYNLSRLDDKLFGKFVFQPAGEIGLKFWSTHSEDTNKYCGILNQEIKSLARQVIRVEQSLHARADIIFWLLLHLKGTDASTLLEAIEKSAHKKLKKLKVVHGRLLTMQDVLESRVRAWLQDRSTKNNYNFGMINMIFLVISVITSLFGINVDGIPGAKNTPYAFALFTGILIFVGILVGLVIRYFRKA